MENRQKIGILRKKATLFLHKTVVIKGWVKTFRIQKSFAFMEVNDGSSLSNMQVVLSEKLSSYKTLLETIQTGCSVAVTGKFIKSIGGKQAFEIEPDGVVVIGKAPSDFILQKKRHSFAFLRTVAHLRPRTNTFGAVTRIRNGLAYATHRFFQERDFLYIQTPILTSLDCEGAGELFEVTAKKEEKPFFGKKTHLTVSGQLNAEAYALAFCDVYAFGPTFRAENSNTSRHLSEFWMVEPEMAFCDLQENIYVAQDYLQYLVRFLLDAYSEDLVFLDTFIKKGLIEALQQFVKMSPVWLSYEEALSLLKKSKRSFTFPVEWGLDLQSEHERFLTDTYFKKSVVIYDYPKEIKPFYMRQNADQKSVAAMDLLVPGIGELVGGGQREERLDVLEQVMEGPFFENYHWYLALRKYGSAPHSGFGLGFERLVQYVTGMENIRDTIPFPRYPQHALF